MYALLMSDEDGRVFKPLVKDKYTVEDLLDNPENFGVETFLTENDLPDNYTKWDPQYWGEGNAMLIKFEVCKVVNEEIVTKRVIAK